MNTRKLVLTSIFVAIGIVLPQTIHLFGGPTLGAILLPMHLPVFIGAMVLGVESGILIAVLSVGIGVALGMPPILIATYMIFELSVYGLLSGYLYKHRKWNVYLSYLVAKVSGMVVALLVTIILLDILGLGNPMMFGTFGMFVPGIPGIIIQLAIVPPIVILLERELKHHE